MRLTGAILDVVRERTRQIDDLGHSLANDDNYDEGVLSGAGAAYALNASKQLGLYIGYQSSKIPEFFAWDKKHWKPKTPREDLVRAAALIIAEIEKIDRQEQM